MTPLMAVWIQCLAIPTPTQFNHIENFWSKKKNVRFELAMIIKDEIKQSKKSIYKYEKEIEFDRSGFQLLCYGLQVVCMGNLSFSSSVIVLLFYSQISFTELCPMF